MCTYSQSFLRVAQFDGSLMRALRILPLVLVVSAAEAPAQTQPERWTLVPELRIGSVNAVNYSLSRIGGMVVDGDGSMFVVQPAGREVRVFDSQGRYVRTIGREGGGPGEFNSAGRIGLRGDTLWVSDIQLSRLTLFSRTGDVLDALTISGPMIPEISTRPTPPSTLAADGTILAGPLTSSRDDLGWIPVVRMDRRGNLIETFGALRDEPPFRLQGTIDGREMRAMVTRPVQMSGLWAVSPVDGSVIIVDRPIATGDGEARFRVQRLRSASDTIFNRNYLYTPKRIPQAGIDSILGRGAILGDSPVPPEMLRQYRDQLGPLRYDAPISQLVAGRDGTIWLRREDLGLQQVDWLVLDDSGEPIAVFQTPASLRILQAERDRVWAEETDDLDVPYLVRYQVQRP
jgi:hypothetical protein